MPHDMMNPGALAAAGARVSNQEHSHARDDSTGNKTATFRSGSIPTGHVDEPRLRVRSARAPGTHAGLWRMSFRHSNEAAFRRAVRDAIRQSALSKSEQAVTLALANLWFHHKPKGEMHPGRAKIARRRASRSRPSPAPWPSSEQAGCLIALSHERGGRASTRTGCVRSG